MIILDYSIQTKTGTNAIDPIKGVWKQPEAAIRSVASPRLSRLPHGVLRCCSNTHPTPAAARVLLHVADTVATSLFFSSIGFAPQVPKGLIKRGGGSPHLLIVLLFRCRGDPETLLPGRGVDGRNPSYRCLLERSWMTSFRMNTFAPGCGKLARWYNPIGTARYTNTHVYIYKIR